MTDDELEKRVALMRKLGVAECEGIRLADPPPDTDEARCVHGKKRPQERCELCERAEKPQRNPRLPYLPKRPRT